MIEKSEVQLYILLTILKHLRGEPIELIVFNFMGLEAVAPRLKAVSAFTNRIKKSAKNKGINHSAAYAQVNAVQSLDNRNVIADDIVANNLVSRLQIFDTFCNLVGTKRANLIGAAIDTNDAPNLSSINGVCFNIEYNSCHSSTSKCSSADSMSTSPSLPVS